MAAQKNAPLHRDPNIPRRQKDADFRFLEILLECSKYYGAIPVQVQKNGYLPKLHRWIVLTLLLFFVAQTCISLPTPDSILTLLQIIWQVIDICFLYSSVYQANFSTSENWSLLLRYLSASEELLGKLGFHSQNQQLKISMQIFSIWTCSFLLIAWNVFFLIREPTGNFASYSWLIVNIYVTTFITIIFLLTKILQRRYRHIHTKIGRQLRKNHLEAFELDFENTVKLLRTMHEVVKQMNSIFGWQFFFFVNIIIIRVVYSCFIAVFFLNPSNPGKQVETVLYVISLILLVLPCDLLEETSKDIVKTCYASHLRIADERTRDRLMDLGRYAVDWKPALSAAGFFAIRKECLNSAFENFVTYLVVSIQFKMSLDSSDT
ncbi:unnamed protein product [Phaedon cochleariae]|uniref:Gustatory receptor n=1 Tax=Phaedon cochleariae TaxID=80249 RepID=A0A9N9SLG1_PHACE|nr:unnamed protein product [Phaedon cochleariae]